MTLGERKNWVGFKLRSSGSSLWLHLAALALEPSPPVSAEKPVHTFMLSWLLHGEDTGYAGTPFVNKKANIFILHSLMYIVFQL